MAGSVSIGGNSVATMQLQLNKGIRAETFKAKVDTILKDDKITAKEFKELAKDVKGGEATLMAALKKISPKFDKDKLLDLPTTTTDSAIKKDDLVTILKSVAGDGKHVAKSANKQEMSSISDSLNLLKAESDDENVKEGSVGGKLVAKLTVEVIHGSIVELTKGGLEGKDKLSSQTKDIINMHLPKAPDSDTVNQAMETSKSVFSMTSCVATFASAIIAIKEAHEDGATVSDLKSVKNKLTEQLNQLPETSVKERAELKTKIGALDKVISETQKSRGGNITEAIGQLINTAGGLMEFSKSVAPHLADSVGVVGNGISAFSGVVTGIATTIKEGVRLDSNRKIKSKAKEFLKNPAKAMLKEKEKQINTITKELGQLKTEKKEKLGEKLDLEKQIIDARRLPDSPERTTKIQTLTTKLTDVKNKLKDLETKIVGRQDAIDVHKLSTAPSGTTPTLLNTAHKTDLQSQLVKLEERKKSLDEPVTGQKAKLESRIIALNDQKGILDTKKTTLDATKTSLQEKKVLLADKKLTLENEKKDIKERLKAAKEDPTKVVLISNLEIRLASVEGKISDVNTDIAKNKTDISDNARDISVNDSTISENAKSIDLSQKNLAIVTDRIAEITTEIGEVNTAITATDTKLTNPTKDAEIEKLTNVAAKYETATGDEKKNLRESIGMTKGIDDLGSQVVKRRSIGHSIFGVVKGLLATGGGIAATVGAIAGASLLAATPVGWALAGAGAVIGLGMIAYKVYKTVQRNKTESKLENQATELSQMKTDLKAQLRAATNSSPPASQEKIDGINAKIADVKKLQARVESMQLKKSPKAAIENIMKTLTDNTPTKTEERNAMQKFVQHVFKIDPASLVLPTAPPPTQDQIKIQESMKKILEKKIPMFA